MASKVFYGCYSTFIYLADIFAKDYMEGGHSHGLAELGLGIRYLSK